ncbi:MAG TPA: ferritin-like domain-containing protein [Acidimicrobiia bacterium]|jgi:rubrerythrin|nr:ferritin-like domain-containing protein [Acidimicrobiia bacterium]
MRAAAEIIDDTRHLGDRSEGGPAEAGALDVDAYDWAAATRTPVRDDELFELTFAAQVEWATEGTYLSLAVTKDVETRRFLDVWLTQERMHAVLLRKFLSEHGVYVEPRHRTPRQRLAARRGRWVNGFAVRVLGRRFTAVHMSWGAINELTTLRLYSLIREHTGNELLRDLLADVIRQESAHYAYYRSAATRELERSRVSRVVTRWLLGHAWDVVGSGLQPPAEITRLMRAACAMQPDLVAQLDATIERLPGLEGLALVRRALAKRVEAEAEAA